MYLKFSDGCVETSLRSLLLFIQVYFDVLFSLVSDHNLLAILSRGHVCSRFYFFNCLYWLALTSDLYPGSGAVTESIENNVVVIAARTYPKDPADYTPDEKEDVLLDINLQLILVESLDPIMYNHVVNCKDAKHIWDTIETINEGTEEVRQNRMEILTSEYEHFKSTSGEGISEVFERYNKLINKLNL